MLVALVVVATGALVAIVALVAIDRRQREEAARWAVTSQVSGLLAESLDPVAVLDEVLRRLVPRFGDWCAVHLVEGGVHVRRAAIVHVDPAIDARLKAIIDLPFDDGPENGPARVIRSGRSQLLRAVDAAMLAQANPATQGALALAGLGSSVVVPMKARQQTLGSLTLTSRRTNRYDERDLSWVEDLGHRIGLALENARLYLEARELFEQTISANFVSTPDGRILACNQSFATLLGMDSVEEVLASPAPSFYANPERREEAIRDLRAHRRLVAFESTVRRRDGGVVAISENAVGTFNERGELTRITGFILDVSAQKDLEEQLRQAQRLEAVGQLAGGVAHDFNNLLTVIIGCADLLHAERAAPSRPADHDPLEELSKAARRAAALTQQLLAFSRRQVLQPQVVDLNAALRAVHSMLRRLVRDNVVLMLDLDQTLDRVRVDPSQLDQVIINLVVNAGDSMAQGGTVRLQTGNTTLGDAAVAQYPYVKPGRYASLIVRDNGAGMDEATRARVFEPFFTTKPAGRGTGLGLSTVYGIVKQSNGYVWIASAPGTGTTVTVCLPAATSDSSG